jgi:hypothetical protein
MLKLLSFFWRDNKMKTYHCHPGIVLSLISVLFLIKPADSFAILYFSDNFDGTTIDNSKWSASTSPPRFQQYDIFGPSGYWVTPSDNQPYGTISVNNSWVSLSNGYSTVFPYVASTVNPFPQTGDFVLELKMRYESVEPSGTGFWVRYADSDSPLTNSIFSVWQDSSSTAYLTAGLFGRTPYLPDSAWQGASNDTSEHIYTLKYINSQYSVSVDGTQLLGPITDSVRPNQICFGNPVWVTWGEWNWTNFSIDSVTVTPEPATILLLGLGGLFLRKRR